MAKFLKKTDLKLLNGGYLSDNKENPVTNDAFVKAQQHAEYIVTFAEFAKGKDFKGKPADSISGLKAEVQKFLYESKPTVFIEKPEVVSRPVTESLAKEAMDFISFQDKSSRVDKINNFLQQFNILNDFEQFGLFFEEGIVKLNKIYTVEDVKTAVTSVIDLLD